MEGIREVEGRTEREKEGREGEEVVKLMVEGSWATCPGSRWPEELEELVEEVGEGRSEEGSRSGR